MEYAIPRADDMPDLVLDRTVALAAESARRQGRPGGRRLRGPAGRRQRGGRRALIARRPPRGHAADAGKNLAGDPATV